MLHEAERQRSWQRDGLFIVPHLLSSDESSRLADTCDHVLEQVRRRSHAVGHVTTHISDLLAPEYFEDRPEALTWLTGFVSSQKVLSLVQDLGKPNEGTLNLRDVQYFHEPSSRDYDGAWHRDGDGPAPLTNEALPNRSTLLRFRIALVADDHLEYVPGSHVRPDTPEEEALRKGASRSAPLSAGSRRIELETGDVCVFDVWGVHRARYRAGRMRKTLDLLFGFGDRRPRSFDPTLRMLAAGFYRR